MEQEIERVLARLVAECGMVRRGRYVKPGLRGDVRFCAGRRGIIVEIRDHAGALWGVDREIPPETLEHRVDAEGEVVARLIGEGADAEQADLL